MDLAAAAAATKLNAMPVNPIPAGYQSVAPYLIVKGAAKAIDFYRNVLGASERMRLDGPEGRIGHAEIQIGDSVVMLADECPEGGGRGPHSFGGTPVLLHLYVEDSDAVFQKAISAGAKVKGPMADKFYGDRAGSFEDPFGHVWHVATHIEDVTPEEIGRRLAAMAAAKK